MRHPSSLTTGVLMLSCSGADVAAEASNGAAEATAPEEPAAEEEPASVPAGWGGWQPLAPQDDGAADPEAADPEADAEEPEADGAAGRSGDEGDAAGEVVQPGPEAAEGGSDGDDSDDQVAAAQPEEEQETEEELLAQCVQLCRLADQPLDALPVMPASQPGRGLWAAGVSAAPSVSLYQGLEPCPVLLPGWV